MRHHKRTRILGRPAAQRRALLKSLVRSLIIHGSIQTTEAKAKEMRPMAERLLTKAKVQSVATHKHVAERLGSKSAAATLIKEIAPKYMERKGGYTRIVKMGKRTSDGSPMAIIQFV